VHGSWNIKCDRVTLEEQEGGKLPDRRQMPMRGHVALNATRTRCSTRVYRGRDGSDRASLIPPDRNRNKALILRCDLECDGGPEQRRQEERRQWPEGNKMLLGSGYSRWLHG